MHVRQKLGAQLKRLRLERNMTQEDLAHRSGLAVDSIRRIERGAFSPSVDTLAKLTEGLQVTFATLFASLDGKRPSRVLELCDLLSSQAPAELKLVDRVVRAILED